MTPRLPFASALAVLLASCETVPVTRQDASSQGTLVANSRPGTTGGTSPAINLAGDPEGLAQHGGRIFYVKDLRATRITGAQRFSSGLHLEKDGDVTLQTGRRLHLREGEMVTLAGELRDAPRNIEYPQ